MSRSGRRPVSCLTLPHPVSSLFPGCLLHQGPDQHSIPHSNPLDKSLFSLLYFWTFWEQVSFWDLLITKSPGFDDHSTCSRSSWMLNRDFCTVLKWTGMLVGYKAVTPCRRAVLNMYFRQLFSPAPLFCSATLPLRGESSSKCHTEILWAAEFPHDKELQSQILHFPPSTPQMCQTSGEMQSQREMSFSCQYVIITYGCKKDPELLLWGWESGKEARSSVNGTCAPQMS